MCMSRFSEVLHAKSHLSHLKDEEKKTSMKRVVAAVVGKNVDGSFAISHTFLIHPQGLMKLTCKVARRNEVACGGLTETTGRSCKYIPYRKERRRTPLENENIQCHLCSVRSSSSSSSSFTLTVIVNVYRCGSLVRVFFDA